MKIRDIISERQINFNQLSSMQVSVLRRMVKNTLSYQTASKRERAIMNQLVALQLLTSRYQITHLGQKMAELASRTDQDIRAEQRRRKLQPNYTEKKKGMQPYDNAYRRYGGAHYDPTG